MFVTHAPDLVRQICDRAVVLDHGKIVLDGAPGEAVRSFREHLFSGDALAVETVTTGRARHTGAVARDARDRCRRRWSSAATSRCASPT